MSIFYLINPIIINKQVCNIQSVKEKICIIEEFKAHKQLVEASDRLYHPFHPHNVKQFSHPCVFKSML